MRKNNFHIFLICVLGILCSNAAEANRNSFFSTAALPGWQTGISSGETQPFISEKLRSEFLWGARSPSGSYIFVSVTDNGNRPALTAGALNAVITGSSFSRFHPVSFDKQIKKVRIEGSDGLDVLVTAMKAKGSGYDFQSAGNIMTVAKTVYFPVVLQQGSQIYNYLLMADFRGRADNLADINAFDRYYISFKVQGSGFILVDADRFDNMQAKAVHTKKIPDTYSAAAERKKEGLADRSNYTVKSNGISIMSLAGKPESRTLPQPLIDIYE